MPRLAALAAPEPLPSALLQPLALALTDSLSHQHSRVRLAALQALHSLVQAGMPMALMDEAVLPAVRPLAADHAPGVRAALFDCAAQWAGAALAQPDAPSDDDEGRAANQCRAFLPLLLPLLMLGLTDEVEATRSTTYALLEAIGARFGGRAGHSAAAGAASADGLPGYCHPFNAGPPAPGTRRLVQAQLARLLQQALAELREWTGRHGCSCCVPVLCCTHLALPLPLTRTGLPSNLLVLNRQLASAQPAATLRQAAARLLRATLIYGEGEVLPQLPTVVHALRTAVADDDAGGMAQVQLVHKGVWYPDECRALGGSFGYQQA